MNISSCLQMLHTTSGAETYIKSKYGQSRNNSSVKKKKDHENNDVSEKKSLEFPWMKLIRKHKATATPSMNSIM